MNPILYLDCQVSVQADQTLQNIRLAHCGVLRAASISSPPALRRESFAALEAAKDGTQKLFERAQAFAT